MTLNTPRINNVGVFDANFAYTFILAYSGRQVVKNKLTIRNNTTNDIVYDEMQYGLVLSHTINANTLSNNVTYNAQVQVFDEDDNASGLSDIIIFNCYTTPQFYFTDIHDDDIVSSANLTCSVVLSQNEGDTIKEYQYHLYDGNKTCLSSSDYYYSLDDASYTYYGLTNNTSYYVRAIGITAYGFEVDTGYIKINVHYEHIPTNVYVTAFNQNGKILINVDIKVVEYILENENYLLENGVLKLYNNAITYKTVDSTDDFAFILKCRMPSLNKIFASISHTLGQVDLSIVNISERHYCKLDVKDTTCEYVKYFFIDISEYDNYITFEIHRENGLYSIKMNK